MWIFTPSGFVSAVYKQGQLQIRARDRESLKLLFPKKKIHTNKGTDYPFRVYSTHDELARVMEAQVRAIHYANFKDEVKKTRGALFAGVLMGVWTTLLRLEPEGATRFIGKGSWRLPRPGKRVKKSKRVYEPEVWDRYDDWESRNRDMPDLVADYPDLLGDYEEHPSLLEENRSIHSLSDEEWAEFEKHGIV
jgi:hypothetical protein